MHLARGLKNRLRSVARHYGFGGTGQSGGQATSATLVRSLPPHTFQPDAAKQKAIELLQACSADAAFYCQMNGFAMVAPASILRLYPHCLHPTAAQHLTYFVETQQSQWLCAQLRPGDTAFDIGAATGVLTLGMARTAGDGGRVFSFEPSRGTFCTLQSLLRHNQLANVEPVPAAIGAASGSTEFIEYLVREDLTWAPDASAIATAAVPPHPHHRYSVDVTTIDSFVASKKVNPRVIKIDIEGFELDALEGGAETIGRCVPSLCIDLHYDPRTGKLTRDAVEAFLTRLGYRHNMQGHALYAEHPRSPARS